jgi:septal ring factor EnvC (AmiA/AmiB activator)
MTGSLTNRVALFALFCLLALTGCKDAEKEKALADAKAANKALSEVKTQLESVTAELATVTEARDQLQAAAKQVATLRDQLTQLTQDRDSALAKAADAQSMVEKLKSRLQEQNSKLQNLIDELKKLGEVEKPDILVP